MLLKALKASHDNGCGVIWEDSCRGISRHLKGIREVLVMLNPMKTYISQVVYPQH